MLKSDPDILANAPAGTITAHSVTSVTQFTSLYTRGMFH